MVRLPHRPNKLAPLYDGPYTVVRKNKGGSYELKDEQNELLHRNYVPSELKVVNIDETHIEDTYVEVEYIRDHRGGPGKREYLVKWKGYGERENSWQKADDFSDPTIIQKYWDKVEELRARNNGKPSRNKRKLIPNTEDTQSKRRTVNKRKNK